MSGYWSRADTKHWIAQLEHRIEDIEYYLRRTVEWCEENNVYEDRIVLACAVMTAAWVSHMRQEPLSKHEIFEILGIDGWDKVEDALFEFNSDYEHLEHEELLQMIINSF
jgi:hypothetical protein